ncbi:hypothetical protein K1719_043733 [Acacia pycnantha]|nr:hypothetical protein K1719_043733 [Acacia pycnantha]
MGEEAVMDVTEVISHQNGSSNHQSLEFDIYPLNGYYFGSTTNVIPFKDETLADRIQRKKSNYAAHGIRNCVEAVMLVELPGESDIDGLKRKLARKLYVGENGDGAEWEVGECLGMWWRPDFETLLYPYLPPSVKSPKECTKLYLVKLPESRKFIVPKNHKLLAVPLCQIPENHETYGTIISGVPQLLSKFSFNIIES